MAVVEQCLCSSRVFPRRSSERGRDQGGITGRICASCLMGAKKFPREG